MNPPTLKAGINNFAFPKACVKPFMFKQSDYLALYHSTKTATKSVNFPTLTAIKSVNLHTSKNGLSQKKKESQNE